LAVLYYRDEKVSLEQQLNMKGKQMQTTKEEIRKIKGEIEEVRFLGQAGGQY
jgi:DNA-binding protein YbaB